MNVFKRIYTSHILNKQAKAYGFKRRKSMFKEPLITKMGIEKYFKECWYVRKVKVIEDKEKYFTVDINIKSWIPLSKKTLLEFKEEKPFGLYTKIHNKHLFGIKEFEI